MYRLTPNGTKKIEDYIKELEAKRKEILDAGRDTADETNIPTVEEIFEDALSLGIDEDGEVYDSWGVTDNYTSDNAICLRLGEDFIDYHPVKNRYYKSEYEIDGTAEDLFLQVRNNYITDPEIISYIADIIETEVNISYDKDNTTATPEMLEQIKMLLEAAKEEVEYPEAPYNVGRIKYEILDGSFKGIEIEEECGLTLSILLDRDQLIVAYQDNRDIEHIGSGGSTISKEEFFKLNRKEFKSFANNVFFYNMEYEEPEEKSNKEESKPSKKVRQVERD